MLLSLNSVISLQHSKALFNNEVLFTMFVHLQQLDNQHSQGWWLSITFFCILVFAAQACLLVADCIHSGGILAAEKATCFASLIVVYWEN